METRELFPALFMRPVTLLPKPDEDTITKENYRPVSLINIKQKSLTKH